jgi:hypothetical protein
LDETLCQDFDGAGLYLRGNKKYYAVIGASNGGVMRVFDREQGTLLWDDGGYVGQAKNGEYITTQMTAIDRLNQVSPTVITIHMPFYVMLRSTPSPLQFVILRILNLTLMRSVKLGNWIKELLVNLLISGKKTVGLDLTRILRFEEEQIVIKDVLKARDDFKLQWLHYGKPFVAIHMASARYFDGHYEKPKVSTPSVSTESLNTTGELILNVKVRAGVTSRSYE